MVRDENLKCLQAVLAIAPHFGPGVKTGKIFNILAIPVSGKSFYLYKKWFLVFRFKLNISVMQYTDTAI